MDISTDYPPLFSYPYLPSMQLSIYSMVSNYSLRIFPSNCLREYPDEKLQKFAVSTLAPSLWSTPPMLHDYTPPPYHVEPISVGGARAAILWMVRWSLGGWSVR